MNAQALTIVLCGGKKRVPTSIETSVSNAMTPINGKPVIGWILDDLIRKQIMEVTIVLRQEDEKFKAFLQRAYAQRMNLTLAPVSGNGTILHSLLAGLYVGRNEIPSGTPARIILGDTLIRDPFEGTDDFVYVGDVQESKRWCLPVVDDRGIITEYIDKKNLAGGSFKAVAGYYHVLDAALLAQCVEQAIARGGKELSAALALYGAHRPVRVREVSEWFDFGHIDNIVDARRRLLQPRHFNSLHVNTVLNTITKVSRNDEKLCDELRWYQTLPAELQVLAPRILRAEHVNGHLHLVQEYYGYPTLAELYVYGDLDAETWFSILRNVLKIHDEFRRYRGKMDFGVVRDFYAEKTRSRLQLLMAQDNSWRQRFAAPMVVWNGKELRNLNALMQALEQRTERLARTATICIIHGDLCFSNILYDITNQIIRLVDPRGSFGEPGIYGDARYDIAKLRHSVAGLYDFFMADMFWIREDGNRYEGELFVNGVPHEVASRFDQMIVRAGYDLDDIRFIEGLLFISMLPLHADHPQRQLMMYLRGLELLNEVLGPFDSSRLQGIGTGSSFDSSPEKQARRSG